MQISQLKKEDIENLVKLMHLADNRSEEWSISKIKKYMKKEGHVILVAKQKDIILGYVGIKELENEDKIIGKILKDSIDKLGCIEWIAVHPKYRRKGIASNLLVAAESWIRKRKREGVWLDCRKKVIPLYEKNGYKIIGELNNEKGAKYVLSKYF